MTEEEKVRDQELLQNNKQFIAKYRHDLIAKHRIGLLKGFRIWYVLKRLWFKLAMRNKLSTEGNTFGEEGCGQLKLDGLRLCVYTCLVGDYDTLKEPVCNEPNIDYIAFTDQEVAVGSKWRKIDITTFPEYTSFGPYKFNRMLKMLPHKYLPEYDYSMYIDASVVPAAYMTPLFEELGQASIGVHKQRKWDCVYDEAAIMCSIGWSNLCVVKNQISDYKRKGFPAHYGVSENMVFIRKHDDDNVQKLMEMWWEEYCKYPTRDQFSLPFVMWSMGYDRGMIHSMGTIDKNYRFIHIAKHNQKSKYRSDE